MIKTYEKYEKKSCAQIFSKCALNLKKRKKLLHKITIVK